MKVGNLYGFVCLLDLVSRPFRKRNSLQDHLVLDIFSKIVWSFSCTSISRFISIKFIPWVIRPILLYMNVICNWASSWVGCMRDFHAKSQGFTLLYKSYIIEISVKSGKDNTSTLSLVIHRVRLKRNLQKSTLGFKGRGETQKPCLDGFSVSPCLSFFPWAPPLLLHRFSLLLPVQRL
jgi:hypothetical protein